MGWWMFLIITWFLVLLSFVFQYFWFISNSLVTREETYILLFAFFWMWLRWLIDDRLNIQWKWKVKWLEAKVKLLWMIALAGWISYWFFAKLGVNYLQLWPLFDGKVTIWLLYPIITFFLTIAIVNAINITDWLDWLAGWMMIILLWVMSIVTFIYGWYLATTLLWIITGTLLAFLLFNINPAKVFMGDSWALALWWLLSTLVYLLNLRDNFIIPFMILFWLFWVELISSFLQIFRKRVFKRKLFAIAPFHHLLEHRGMKEYTIVMKFWVIQWILACITLIIIFYQLHN
jgi:phospho-N-acetylmuramoyl-pentapeptide-transferase